MVCPFRVRPSGPGMDGAAPGPDCRGGRAEMTGNRETIAIASDHAGFELKETLKGVLAELDFAPLDLGTSGSASRIP